MGLLSPGETHDVYFVRARGRLNWETIKSGAVQDVEFRTAPEIRFPQPHPGSQGRAGRASRPPAGPGDAEEFMYPEDQSWEQWPEWLRSRALQVLEQVRAGHPDLAVDVVDELISDLGSRRQILAEGANRRFEPSTDDRHA